MIRLHRSHEPPDFFDAVVAASRTAGSSTPARAPRLAATTLNVVGALCAAAAAVLGAYEPLREVAVFRSGVTEQSQ